MLEFLGDGFLGAVVGKYLMDRFEDEQEGFLTKIRTRLVRSSMLYRFARFLNLGEYILVSPQVERLTLVGPLKGKQNPKIYEDCFEAFIGAIIQDFGDEDGYKYAKRFIVSVIEHLVDFAEIVLCNENHKDTLQRYFQSNSVGGVKWENPRYIDLLEIGSSHTRQFVKSVFLPKIYYEQLPQSVKDCVREYHSRQTDPKTQPNIKIIAAINQYCTKNNTFVIGAAAAGKKSVADQECSALALVNLSVPANF